nr:hypothetical protein [uncultured Mediterranean phage uvMED]
MKLNEIIKIQSVIDNRSIASDTLQILEKKRFSKSKNKEIKIGEMDIDHFLRSLNLNGFLDFNKTKNEIETEKLIKKLKSTVVKINNKIERGY